MTGKSLLEQQQEAKLKGLTKRERVAVRYAHAPEHEQEQLKALWFAQYEAGKAREAAEPPVDNRTDEEKAIHEMDDYELAALRPEEPGMRRSFQPVWRKAPEND